MSKAIIQRAPVSLQIINIIGGMILVARKSKQWRQVDLAKRLGITRQTVARMESGDPNIAIGTYFEAAWILELPILPGIEVRQTQKQDLLNDILQYLNRNLPERINMKIGKPIDDKF